MSCKTPVTISLKKPKFDFEGKMVTSLEVPCGKCYECRRRRVKDWTTRLLIESQEHLFNYFLTLTYNDESVPVNNEGLQTLSKRDVQLFLKRLRKKYKFRYFLIGEYGGITLRPHYHAIMFSDIDIKYDDIEKCWSQGFVKFGTVTYGSCAYVAKYHTIGLDNGLEVIKPFCLMSRKPGIAEGYIEKKNNGTVMTLEGITPILMEFDDFCLDILQENYIVIGKGKNLELYQND